MAPPAAASIQLGSHGRPNTRTDTTPANTEAGEDIRVLSNKAAHELNLPDHDFWLFDDALVAIMHFDDDGMIAADNLADLERELAKLDGGALSPSYLQDLLARIRSRRPMLRALADSINDGGAQRHSIVGDLERVKVPVTAIFGVKDRVIPWQHAAQLPAHAAVHFVKNAGHMPHWAAPNLAADLLLGRR